MNAGLLIAFVLAPMIGGMFLTFRATGGLKNLHKRNKPFGRHSLATIPIFAASLTGTYGLAVSEPVFEIFAYVIGTASWGLIFFILYKHTNYQEPQSPENGADNAALKEDRS